MKGWDGIKKYLKECQEENAPTDRQQKKVAGFSTRQTSKKVKRRRISIHIKTGRQKVERRIFI